MRVDGEILRPESLRSSGLLGESELPACKHRLLPAELIGQTTSHLFESKPASPDPRSRLVAEAPVEAVIFCMLPAWVVESLFQRLSPTAELKFDFRDRPFFSIVFSFFKEKVRFDLVLKNECDPEPRAAALTSHDRGY